MVFSHRSFDGHEQVIFCHDSSVGLEAIIAHPRHLARPCRGRMSHATLRVDRRRSR